MGKEGPGAAAGLVGWGMQRLPSTEELTVIEDAGNFLHEDGESASASL